MALTPKQARFVAEYLLDANATQAAIRAGYSEKTAHAIGHENLSKPEIAAALKAAEQKRLDRLEITADDLLRDVKEIRGLAKGDGKYGDALKANSMLGASLKDANPFTETTTTKVELGDDTLAGQELLRTLAFLLASGAKGIAAPAAPPQETKH
jgi:hypothetical protein